MQRGKPTRLGAILLILVIIILAISGILWIARTLFGDVPKPTAETAGVKALTEITDASGVRMMVRGPIVAGEDKRSYAITIRPNARTMTTYRGYMGEVVRTENLPNDTKAYTELSFALKRAGMMNSRELNDASRDLRGICAAGLLYQFETLNYDEVIESLFVTSCDTGRGSFAGLLSSVQELFLRQIPNQGELRREIDL